MKKNFFIVSLLIFIIGLFLKRFSMPSSDLTLILGVALLAIGYIVRGLKNLYKSDYSISLRILTITSSLYLSLTVIGIIFRHQWWRLPYFNIIFWGFWPIMTIGLLIQLLIYLTNNFRIENKIFRRQVIKNLIIPLIVILPIAITTYFTSTKTFCKIYKAYTSEELYHRWEVQKQGK